MKAWRLMVVAAACITAIDGYAWLIRSFRADVRCCDPKRDDVEWKNYCLAPDWSKIP